MAVYVVLFIENIVLFQRVTSVSVYQQKINEFNVTIWSHSIYSNCMLNAVNGKPEIVHQPVHSLFKGPSQNVKRFFSSSSKLTVHLYSFYICVFHIQTINKLQAFTISKTCRKINKLNLEHLIHIDLRVKRQHLVCTAPGKVYFL